MIAGESAVSPEARPCPDLESLTALIRFEIGSNAMTAPRKKNKHKVGNIWVKDYGPTGCIGFSVQELGQFFNYPCIATYRLRPGLWEGPLPRHQVSPYSAQESRMLPLFQLRGVTFLCRCCYCSHEYAFEAPMRDAWGT